jgi:LysM repeat protein
MHLPNARRIGVVAWPFVAGAVLLAACGADDDAAPSRSTIELNDGSTAFVVKEPVTTVGGEAGEDGTVSTAQEYTVQAGDYPIKVAEQFGVPLDELVAFNEWSSESEFPFPGSVIKIPPGGTAQGASAEESDDDENAGGSARTTAPGTTVAAGDTIPEAGDNCAEGTYTIAEGDSTRIAVAEKFDVTVAALDAANAGTPGYSAFYPGLEIIIPAKADC